MSVNYLMFRWIFGVAQVLQLHIRPALECGNTPFNKTYFTFYKRHKSRASCLGMGLHVYLFLSVLKFCLIWMCTTLAHAVKFSVSSSFVFLFWVLVFLRERNHEVEWIRMWKGTIKIWGNGKHAQNLLDEMLKWWFAIQINKLINKCVVFYLKAC